MPPERVSLLLQNIVFLVAVIPTFVDVETNLKEVVLVNEMLHVFYRGICSVIVEESNLRVFQKIEFRIFLCKIKNRLTCKLEECSIGINFAV